MKLRNKKTREIGIPRVNYQEFYIDTEHSTYCYKTLDAMYCEWEDYEGPSGWIDEVKIQELPSGLKIADRDYYEIDEDGEKKTEFTWDEAMEIEKKTGGKWRLPTPKELNQMAVDLGYDDDGVFDGKLFAKNLGIEERFKKDGYGNYWSLRSASTTYSNGLYFYNTYLNPQNNNTRGYGFAVRCVAE